MTLEESILALRLRVMRRAQQLGNVSAACREAGISRTLLYRCRHRFERYGADGLHPQRRQARPGRPRHIEAGQPEELVCLNTFYLGKLKGVGKVWQLTACDAACSYGVARLLPALAAEGTAHFLRAVLVPLYRRAGRALPPPFPWSRLALPGTCRAGPEPGFPSAGASLQREPLRRDPRARSMAMGIGGRRRRGDLGAGAQAADATPGRPTPFMTRRGRI